MTKRGEVASLAGAVMVFGLAILACGKVQHGKVEQSIKDKLATKGMALTSLTCPDRPIKKGDTFDCDGVDSDGQKLTFHVEQTDDTGSVDWKLDGMIINKQKIGDSIEKSVGAAADVRCPEKTVVMKVGESFTCDLHIGAQMKHVELTLTNDKGDVSWVIKD
jgi:hypothetical protein